MPFAQWHAPFENQEIFEQRFPADYICEALDQTRGWFYSLLAISTMLFGRSSYETVLCLGLILDPEGQKMSKSRGNIVEPVGRARPPRGGRVPLVLLHLEAAVGRLPLLGRDGRRVGAPVHADSSGTRTASTSLYANVNDVEPARPGSDFSLTPLDRLGAVAPPRDDGDGDRADGGLRHDVRRPRGRAASSTTSRTGTCAVRGAASGTATRARSATLRECLVTVAKLLAPLTPFIADEIYDNLDGSEPSVHLCDFPEPGRPRRRSSSGRCRSHVTLWSWAALHAHTGS